MCAPLALALCALALLPASLGGAAVSTALNATPESPAARWKAWLAEEVVAHKYSRTREELRVFGERCSHMAPAWAAQVDAHASLARVVVIDSRHNWNGLGDSHERWNFLLRVGRSLGRAAFLWTDGCADEAGPGRAASPGVPADVRPPGCRFDPGAYVTGFGGVSWRWDSAARRRVARAQGAGAAELAVQYQCLQEGHRGCVDAVLRWAGNATEALRVSGDSGEDTAGPVLDFLTALDAPWLRLETTVQGDLTREAFSAKACAAAGHPDKPECSQSCESFINWRPRPRTWAALRPSLLHLDAWHVAAAVTVRTGAADHVGETPAVLSPDQDVPADELAPRLETMFTPCAADAPAFRRDRKPGEAPCVHWRCDDAAAPLPDAQLARQCAGSATPPREADAEHLFNVSSGPFGAFIECAARGAAALAALDGSPDSWGVMLFSDAPALRCVLEASALAKAGHVASTPSVPGHIQYAPQGAVLRGVGLAAVTDWYLLGLMDLSLAAFSSAFAGAANVRNFRPPRSPAGAPNPGIRRGFERWFEPGRENHGLSDAADVASLQLLVTTHDGCPVQQRGVRDAARMYARAAAGHGGDDFDDPPDVDDA